MDEGYGDFETVRDAQKLMESEARNLGLETKRNQEGGLRGTGSATGNGLNAVLLVSGENDDLSGDFMAAVVVDGIVEFRY